MARIAKQNIREKILEAAERRLWHYGIKKTTIDEIAADAGVGKGTVYLYFDSKEDISLAIWAGYKSSMLESQKHIAGDASLTTYQKIREFLLFPVVSACNRCAECPEALELIAVLKPYLSEHLKPYLEKEVLALASVLDDGVTRGDLCIDDTLAAARSLKFMTMGFYPPYPCVNGIENIEQEIDAIVNLAIRGLSKNSTSPELASP
jgi:AcrR family transcriptional regulator